MYVDRCNEGSFEKILELLPEYDLRSLHGIEY